MIENAKTGDSLMISSVGFDKIELIAQENNKIKLTPGIQTLEAVEVTQKKGLNEYQIQSFKKPKRNRQWYNNGHYSIGGYFEYEKGYQSTPFVNTLSIITYNLKESDVLLSQILYVVYR